MPRSVCILAYQHPSLVAGRCALQEACSPEVTEYKQHMYGREELSLKGQLDIVVRQLRQASITFPHPLASGAKEIPRESQTHLQGILPLMGLRACLPCMPACTTGSVGKVLPVHWG